RYQERQRRTWCWSNPTSPLPVWKTISSLQRCPATRTRTASGTGTGHPAAVEGQLPGSLVAADQQPVLPGLAIRSRVEADERPVVPAVALGALAGRHLLPCPRRDTPKQGISAAGSGAEGNGVVTGDRQHVTDAAGLQLGAQPRVGAVDLVAGDPGGRDAGVQRAGEHLTGQGRLGGEPDLVGDAGGAAAG